MASPPEGRSIRESTFAAILSMLAAPGLVAAGEPLILEPGEGDTVWLSPESPDHLGSGGELEIYVDPETHPHARASFARFTLGVGGSLPVHRHDRTEEFAYFVSGSGEAVFVDGEGNETAVPVTAGFAWYNPQGQWHAVRNTGDEPLSLVFATVPNDEKGLMSFFRKIGSAPGQEGVPMTLEEFQRIGAEHDMTLYVPEQD